MGEETLVYEYDDIPVEKDENTDEVKDIKKEEASQDTFDEEVEEVSPAEERARSDGWVPKDEWKGDPDDWVEAKEFNLRGELMGRIKSQSSDMASIRKELKSTKDSMKALAEHQKKIATQEYDRALKDIKVKLREAREEDDYELIDELEENRDEIKEAKKELEVEETDEKEDNTETSQFEATTKERNTITNWVESNKWYNEDELLRGAADTLMRNYFTENGRDIPGAIKYMENKMKERFPSEFNTGGGRKRSTVTESDGRASGKTRKSSKSKFTEKDLNEDQKRFGKEFVEMGVYKNIQEYVNSLEALGEIEA